MSNVHNHLRADLGASAPAGEIALTQEIVKALIQSQFPKYANLPVQFVAEGWDNAMFRLGDNLCVRLPRRAVGADLLEREQEWLPSIAPRLPLPIPVALHIGQAGPNYPWTWSIVPWLPGQPIGTGRLSACEGSTLGAFLKALHIRPPTNAPTSDCRGGPLTTRADMVNQRVERLAGTYHWVVRDILPIWAEGLEAPDDAEHVWLHGDLHPNNVLMIDDKLSAIIDWGDMCQGDPATDLAALWLLLPNPESRALAIKVYQPTQATLKRARGWAITWGLILLETGLINNPQHAAIGETILQQVLMG